MSVGPDGRRLTTEEQAAIAALQRLAKRWPQSLSLFSWSGSLVVFKTDEWGPRDHEHSEHHASDYIVANVYGIPNDGGDPN